MGVRREAESIAMLWPWFARITQSDGSVDVGKGEERVGLGFIEKRFLALSFTAVRISGKVTFRDFRRFQESWGFVSLVHFDE